MQTEQNNQNKKNSNSFLGNAQGREWHSAGRVERAISSIQPGGSRLIQERNIFHHFFCILQHFLRTLPQQLTFFTTAFNIWTLCFQSGW